MRKVGHMYLAVTSVNRDPWVKESMTIKKSSPFTNPTRPNVALTALKAHAGNEVDHRESKLNHSRTRVW